MCIGPIRKCLVEFSTKKRCPAALSYLGMLFIYGSHYRFFTKIHLRNLLFLPCYLSSPFRQEQSFTDGASLERLLLERMLLRKELRLRSMQERLLEQERTLEQLSSRLAELESLPGYRSFLALSRQLGQATAAGERGVSMVRLGLTWLLSTLYQVKYDSWAAAGAHLAHFHTVPGKI